jgi:hypothetical protein
MATAALLVTANIAHAQMIVGSSFPNPGFLTTSTGATFKTIGDRKLDPHLIYRLHYNVDRITACTWAGALRAVSQPDAHAVMGDVEFIRTVVQGGCGAMGGGVPIVIERQTKEFSVARQYFANVDAFSRSVVVWNRDLVGYDGRPPHDIQPNPPPSYYHAPPTNFPLLGY